MEIHLMEDMFTNKEFEAINECLRSGRYTQGKRVQEFEKKFAEYNGSKYSVMVNSGSSANLIMAFMLKQKYGLNDGDEVIVPAVTWPTTVYPLLQHNLNPVFCDVDSSFNMDPESIKRMISKKTKAIFLVHLLGQPANIEAIQNLCKKHSLILIEDACESLGASYNNKKVGSFGEMGSFSFYFGHHMTTVEGGMVVTDDLETYDLLKSARSHGWVRGSLREKNYEDIKHKNFLFDMLGYNLRSTDINAAIGLVQLPDLDKSIKIRVKNLSYFVEKTKDLPIKQQVVDLSQTSSFSMPIILESKEVRDELIEYLASKEVESRVVVAGNLLEQPVFKEKSYRSDEIVIGKEINDKGLYLPNHQKIGKDEIDYMVDCIKEYLKKGE